MQSVVTEIFKALGGSTAIALGINLPIQTVNDWHSKGKAEIPPWRRGAVLAFAKRKRLLPKLSADCVAYLESQERTVGRKADTTTGQAAA